MVYSLRLWLTAEVSLPDAVSVDSTPSSLAENTSSDTLVVGAPQKTNCGIERVDPDPDPDILVLGFQELDLSVEALLYSVSTVREDAWCTAAFAALGEKGDMYEKV